MKHLKKVTMQPASDVFSVSKNSSSALKGLDTSFLKDNAQLVKCYQEIQWDNIGSLNALVASIEQVVVKYKDPNDAIKKAIEDIYMELLQKYPLFFGYWKRFTAVEYQLFGLEKSIATLAKAVEVFPTSLELWCDYLNVLCANSSIAVELIRTNFRIAKEMIGYQFLSHKFWDIYIEFESSHKQWRNVSSIYQELITIPLHQYAKYGAAYKTFLLSEHSTIADEEVDVKLHTTQQVVTAIWPFESKIKQSFFNLNPIPSEELENWDRYLDFLLNNKSELHFTKVLIKAVFERSLIPCLYYEHFWIKYANWIGMENQSDIHTVVELYQRGTSALPISSKMFRAQYLTFLKRAFTKDKDFVFTIFTEATAEYMKLWPSDSFLMAEYLSLLKRFQFGSTIEQQDREILSKQTSYSKFLESTVTSYLDRNMDRNIPLHDMVNDYNLSVVVVELIKVTWLVLKNAMQTRKHFNLLSKNPLLKSSVSFWLTYYKFEKSNQNFTKLNKFINNLGTEIFLPTTIINDILADYKTFYLTNATIADYQTLSATADNRNEIPLVDPILYSQLKINNPRWIPGQYRYNADWHKTREFKENGHPGIIDEKPQVSNILIELSSKSFGNNPPSLPTFRNLEKINQPMKYDDIFNKDYLKIDKKVD